MWPVFVLIGIVFNIGGCGGGGPDGPGPDGPGPDGPSVSVDGERSGTRLKLQWFDFGGTRRWTSFYDTQRAETCSPREWSDGKSYCLPTDPKREAPVYLDAACTQPANMLFRDPRGCDAPPPAYMVEYAQVCPRRVPHRLYRLGDRRPDAKFYTSSFDGVCEGPFDFASSADIYAAGAEVPLTELAAGTLVEPSTGRLAVQFYEGNDGSRLPITLRDIALDSECRLDPTDGATSFTCEPFELGLAIYFADQACTRPVAYFNSPRSCPAPQVIRYDPDGCTATPNQYFAPGAPITGQLYSSSSGTCESAPTGSEPTVLLGSALTLATASRAPDATAGRLRTVHLGLPGAAQFRDPYLYDTALETECLTSELADGTTRCLPSRAFVEVLYTDAACTIPIKVARLADNLEYNGGSCAALPAPKYALERPGIAQACKAVPTMYPVTERYTGPLYKLDGACFEFGSSYKTWFRVGEALPIDEFSLATAGRDP